MTKIAFVTDVMHFVGRPSVTALKANGFQVFATDKDFDDGDKAAAFAKEFGATAIAPASPDDIIAQIVDQTGRLDVLVSNDAHPADKAPLGEITEDFLDDVYKNLITQPYLIAQAAAAPMRAQKDGKIIFVTSAAPLRGIPNYGPYAMARGAVNAMVNTLAQELGRDNIQVNALAPNFVESEDYFPKALRDDPEIAARILSRVPLKRFGTPEEAGEAVAFLASPDCRFITGHVLPFAGGWA